MRSRICFAKIMGKTLRKWSKFGLPSKQKYILILNGDCAFYSNIKVLQFKSINISEF